MTATLRLELENVTRKGFDEIVKDFERMGIKGKNLDKVLEGVNRELGSCAASDMAKRVKELSDEYNGTIDAARRAKAEQTALEGAFVAAKDAVLSQSRALRSLDDAAQNTARHAGKLADYNRDLQAALDERKVAAYRREVNKLADEMSGLGSANNKVTVGFPKWSQITSAVGIAKQAVSGFVSGLQQANEMVSVQAERGVPAFGKLHQSIEKVYEAVLDFGDDPVLQQWAESTADAIDNFLIPSLKSTVSWFTQISDDAIESALRAEAGWMRFFGTLTEQEEKFVNIALDVRRNALDAQAKAREKEAADRRAEREQAKADALEDLADPGKRMRLEQEKAAEISQITQLESKSGIEHRINELKKKQLALIEEITEKSLDPTKNKKVIENAKELVQLEKRRFELIKSHREQEAEMEEFLWKKEIAHIEERMRKEKEAVQAGIEGERALLNAREARRQAERTAEQEKVDKLKEFILRGAGGGAGAGFGGGGFGSAMMNGGGMGMAGGFNPALGGQMPMGGRGWGGMMGMGGQNPNWKWIDTAGGSKDIIGALGRGITPQRIFKQVQKDREEAALKAWRDEQRAAGLMDQNGILIDKEKLAQMSDGEDRGPGGKIIKWRKPRTIGQKWRPNMVLGPNGKMIKGLGEWVDEVDPNDDGGPGEGWGARIGEKPFDPREAARQRGRTRAQEEAIRRKARLQVFQDARKGKIGHEEFADAQGDFLKEAADNVIAGGRLSGTMIKTLTQSVSGLRDNKVAIGKLQDRADELYNEIIRVQNMVVGRGQNATTKSGRAGGAN